MALHHLSPRRAVTAAVALAAGAGSIPALAAPVGAAPAELFISEYVEGSSNNKALELFNGTGSAVDLAADGYVVQVHFNGNPTAGLTIDLAGSVAAGDVFVLAHGSAAPAILADADQTNGAGWFNGDDAIVVRRGGGTGVVVDSIGQVGVDPGSRWGSGETSTADSTLRRKAAVESGDTDPTDPFDPAAEWEGHATDTFDGLGAHGTTPPPPPPVDIGACGDPATAIHAVQGGGPSSTLAGQVVEVEGVVVGDFQGGPALGGFHVQEEDADADADPATSEGLFVYDGGDPEVDVADGDLVRVMGTVAEHQGLTELTDVTAVAVCDGDATVTSAPLALPVATLDRFEALESMLVVATDLVVTETFDLDRYGSLSLADDRLSVPTNVVEPGAPAQALAEQNDRSRVELDDGRSSQNPLPVPYLDPATGTRRVGDTVTSLTGVLEHRFDRWRIQPTTAVAFEDTNPRPAEPEPVGGELQVASFNVLNYFTTIDAGPDVCGPSGGLDCRGADSQAELDRQREKVVAALLGLDADVVGLVELENDDHEAVADLVAAMNDATAPGRWAYVDTGTIGTDAIKVGLIHRTDVVAPTGNFAVLDSSVDPRFIDTRNRPALAQTFTQLSDGARFTVVVNHLKSKGSDCDEMGDPDTGDGQGNCNQTRTRAAEAVVDWIDGDPTGSGDPDVLVIGDLNAYAEEDPIDVLERAGYVDGIERFQGERAYSYVFRGESGYLDHALASATLAPQVVGVTEWHINADEPPFLDYDVEFDPPGSSSPDPYRSSDHDPVLVGLDLNAAPVCSEASPTVRSLWPPNGKLRPIGVTGVTDADGDDVAVTVTDVLQDEPVGRAVDAVIDGDVVRLRAERAGGGDGRAYHVRFDAADGRGGTCTGEVVVTVPNHRGQNGGVVDGGALHDSTVA